MKVLGLDISTKTGYSLFEDGQLKSYGLLALGRKVMDCGVYPFCYVNAADAVVSQIKDKIIETKPDVIVIEQTNKGRNRFHQKILEFIHCKFLTEVRDYKVKVVYINTSEWRKVLGQHATKEDKKNNAKINKAAKQGISKKELGLKGKVTAKHRSVRYVNEKFNLNFKIKDNDITDCISLTEAYLKGAKHDNGI